MQALLNIALFACSGDCLLVQLFHKTPPWLGKILTRINYQELIFQHWQNAFSRHSFTCTSFFFCGPCPHKSSSLLQSALMRCLLSQKSLVEFCRLPFLPEVSAPTSTTVKLKKHYVNFLLNTQSLIDMSVSVKKFAAYNEYFYLRGRI